MCWINGRLERVCFCAIILDMEEEAKKTHTHKPIFMDEVVEVCIECIYDSHTVKHIDRENEAYGKRPREWKCRYPCVGVQYVPCNECILHLNVAIFTGFTGFVVNGQLAHSWEKSKSKSAKKTANATRTLLKLIAGSIEVKRENGFGYGRIDTGVQSKHQWLVHA